MPLDALPNTGATGETRLTTRYSPLRQGVRVRFIYCGVGRRLAMGYFLTALGPGKFR